MERGTLKQIKNTINEDIQHFKSVLSFSMLSIILSILNYITDSTFASILWGLIAFVLLVACLTFIPHYYSTCTKYKEQFYKYVDELKISVIKHNEYMLSAQKTLKKYKSLKHNNKFITDLYKNEQILLALGFNETFTEYRMFGQKSFIKNIKINGEQDKLLVVIREDVGFVSIKLVLTKYYLYMNTTKIPFTLYEVYEKLKKTSGGYIAIKEIFKFNDIINYKNNII